MKTLLKVMVVAFPFFLGTQTHDLLHAQGAPTRPTSGSLTAVVDINQVFEKHVGFKQKMEQLKAEVKGFETEVNQQQKVIATDRKKLDGFKTSSREYKQIEENIARQVSTMQVRMQLKRKEIVDREAQNYYEAYSQIQSVVRQIADAHQIALVIRYDSRKIDPQKRESVIKGVNQPVVFQRNLDITQMVVQQVNRGG